MPVVPYVRKQDSRGQGFSPTKPVVIPDADEPWVLMAAAQMDQQGRLTEPAGPLSSTPSEGTTDGS